MQRIVGGRNTSIFQFPWQVSLRSLRNGRHFCGGTIINRYTIVTAAHCVGNNDADAINIRVGSSFHNRSGSFRAVSRIVQHPLYDRNTTDNDIALVILSLPLFYNERVQPARLPAFEYEIENNSTVLVSGWGTLKSGDRILPTRLQFVEIQTVDQERCREAYRDMDGHSANITDNMFCAGAQGGGKDSCQVSEYISIDLCLKVRHNVQFWQFLFSRETLVAQLCNVNPDRTAPCCRVWCRGASAVACQPIPVCTRVSHATSIGLRRISK